MPSGSPLPYDIRYDDTLGTIVYSFQTGWTALPSSAFPLSPATMQRIFTPVAADPSSPVEGQVWYNTTTHTWKGYNGSATVTFTVS